MYNILVVDDSLFVHKQLSQIFRSQGWSVISTALNGKEALQQYKLYFPDVHLVCMDITMPVMDGFEALKEIISFDVHATVVMITAAGMEELVFRALHAGAKGYIVKPLNREKVLKRVRHLLMGG